MPRIDKTLGDILIENNVLTPVQLEEALQEHKRTREFLGRTAVEMGYATEQDIVTALGIQQGMEQIDLSNVPIEPEAVKLIPRDIARFYYIMPVRRENGILTVAMANPLNLNIIDDLNIIVGCEVRGAISTQEDVLAAIDKHYGTDEESANILIDGLLDEIGVKVSELTSLREELVDETQLIELADKPEVIRLLNLVILQAIQSRASDLHFEPFEDRYQIRHRVDGVLHTIASPSTQLSVPISARIKVMSNLNIAERRLPQDGRVQLSIGGKDVDLRISCLPTMFGESIVMRILDRSAVMINLEELGLELEDLENIQELIRKPNGIILVTGPTGSGKTTSMYACLNEINDVSLKIITTEDPVEYEVRGIVQVHINERVGLTFARCLRAILRQDPDIIMVGEVRDLDTARMAIESSLTGHLVFSTLHTNDAPSTITRLIDMKIEPFYLTSTVEAIIAQRLVRRLCDFCKEPYKPPDEELSSIDMTREQIEDKTIFRAREGGCPECNFIGYKGRTGLFEVMVMTEDLRQLVLRREPSIRLKETAIREGMIPLRMAGQRKVLAGITGVEEVALETQD